MENKIIFLLVAIVLIYVMFTKNGIAIIKRVLGMNTGNTSTGWGDVPPPKDKDTMSGGTDISSGVMNG